MSPSTRWASLPCAISLPSPESAGVSGLGDLATSGTWIGGVVAALSASTKRIIMIIEREYRVVFKRIDGRTRWRGFWI